MEKDNAKQDERYEKCGSKVYNFKVYTVSRYSLGLIYKLFFFLKMYSLCGCEIRGKNGKMFTIKSTSFVKHIFKTTAV